MLLLEEVWKAITKQSSYTAKLEEQINDIKTKANNFAGWINVLMQVKIDAIDQKMPSKQLIRQLHENEMRSIEALEAHINATLLSWKADCKTHYLGEAR